MNYRNDRKPGRSPSKIKRVLLNIAVVAGVLLTLSLVVIAVSKSGYLNTRVYTVRGNSFLTAEEIFDLSGLEMGTNLYSLNLGKIEDRLEDDPRIGGAVVRRRFPDSVIIEVEETRPVAVTNIGGSLYKIAADGIIIAPLDGQYEDLPYLFGVEAKAMGENAVGKKISGEGIELGLEVASKLADCPVLGIEVNAIRADKRVMYLGKDGVIVRYNEELSDNQISRLARIWGILPESEATYEIDVRYGNDVIVRGL